VNGLEKEYSSRVTFTRVNVLNPKNQPVMDQYGFETAPQLLLVDVHGKVLGAWDNGVTFADLKQAFDSALSK
jgi:hypothetical protein